MKYLSIILMILFSATCFADCVIEFKDGELKCAYEITEEYPLMICVEDRVQKIVSKEKYNAIIKAYEDGTYGLKNTNNKVIYDVENLSIYTIKDKEDIVLKVKNLSTDIEKEK